MSRGRNPCGTKDRCEHSARNWKPERGSSSSQCMLLVGNLLSIQYVKSEDNLQGWPSRWLRANTFRIPERNVLLASGLGVSNIIIPGLSQGFVSGGKRFPLSNNDSSIAGSHR